MISTRSRKGSRITSYNVCYTKLLRQGIGRLLRRSDDFGVIALLDRRVVTRGYGAVFRENLPEMPWTRERSAVADFFRRFRTGRKQTEKENAE